MERLAGSQQLLGTGAQMSGRNFWVGLCHPERAWCSLDLPFSLNLHPGSLMNRVTWEFPQQPVNLSSGTLPPDYIPFTRPSGRIMM